MQDLFCKEIEIISLLLKSLVNEYDFDNENYDDLPIASQRKLSKTEQDKLMWKTVCDIYKDMKAGEYFNKAFEMLESRP